MIKVKVKNCNTAARVFVFLFSLLADDNAGERVYIPPGFDTHSHPSSGMVEGYEGPLRQARPLAMIPQVIDGRKGRYPLARSSRPEHAGRSDTRRNSRVDAERG